MIQKQCLNITISHYKDERYEKTTSGLVRWEVNNKWQWIDKWDMQKKLNFDFTDKFKKVSLRLGGRGRGTSNEL